ncbi:endoglucanase 25 [Ricinus communis]|uniref:Endoglucanase n=1 Tax=Ricinus communis TaxID=3988 RepID=B9RNI2_RICCO|nr:endoglucanase 25 [Ricinus communis]EEF47305.1 endo-1,4-beta-glucanase, putative [Ricinus communis]|eukprot:XP_002515321.1 endoglucanase 25 [Ricinus communis]
MLDRNIWGGSFEITPATPSFDDGDVDCDRGAYRSQSEEEVKQSWLLRPDKETERRKKRSSYVDGMIIRTLFVVVVLVGFIAVVVTVATKNNSHWHPLPGPDNYTIALRQALMFFNAQRSGKLPKENNVSWRGDSGLKDEIVGGYYDGGNAIKYTFPASFAMTILSWSVIEYSAKYEAAGELDHVKGIIRWGTDYLLNAFNSSSKWISNIASQVGGEHDQHCWMRPEDIDTDSNYPRHATWCYNCPAVAAETVAALAAASIVFKESGDYSKKLVHGAEKLFQFATKGQGENYKGIPDPPTTVYNSSGFWDEFVWGGAWLYCATGNDTYLQFATSPGLAEKDTAFWGGPNRGVLSWNNKHAGAQLLLSRMRIFLGYGYPYEEMLSTFQNHVEDIMCSYLPAFPTFKRTKGGLIQLNHGRPRPLQYAANAAFMATLFSDYLEANLVSGWQCGQEFYTNEALRNFARSQIDYILGKNPCDMSYIVGFGSHFPQQAHHRGASIPNSKVKYRCKDGWQWQVSRRPNPNTIIGAMVAGPDKEDGFQDIRYNYNYTEPTIAGNAGLIAALVALTGGRTSKIDKNTIFSAIPPLYTFEPPPPAPWTP